jgi:hypothetical protein
MILGMLGIKEVKMLVDRIRNRGSSVSLRDKEQLHMPLRRPFHQAGAMAAQ